MPGPVNYVTDAITDGRRHNLDAYVKNLLSQPDYIAHCDLVKQFFKPREGDFEIDPNVDGDEYRLSEGSQQSSNPDSRAHEESSDGNYPLSAPPSRQRNDSVSQSAPEFARQASGMSQAPAVTSPNPPQALKVKIYYGDDVIAIRVGSDIEFQALYEKIRDRLQIPHDQELLLNYKDEPSGERPQLISNNDLDIALSRNDKLVIYVEVAPQ